LCGNLENGIALLGLFELIMFRFYDVWRSYLVRGLVDSYPFLRGCERYFD